PTPEFHSELWHASFSSGVSAISRETSLRASTFGSHRGRRSGCFLESCSVGASSISERSHRRARSSQAPGPRGARSQLWLRAVAISFVPVAPDHAVRDNLRRFCRFYKADGRVPWVGQRHRQSSRIQDLYPNQERAFCLFDSCLELA